MIENSLFIKFKHRKLQISYDVVDNYDVVVIM